MLSTRIGSGAIPTEEHGLVPASVHEMQLESDDLLNLFWRARRRLVIAMLAGALAGLLWSLPREPVYRAEAALEVLDRDEEFLGMRGVSPTNTGGPNASRVGLATHGEILRSRSLKEKTLSKLNAAKSDSDTGTVSWFGAWTQAEVGVPAANADQISAVQLRMAARSLEVSVPAETHILQIQSDSTDPNQAALFLNTLADVYIEENLRSRWETVQETERWLDEQLAGLRAKLEKSQEDLQRYARQSGLLFVSPQESVAEQRLGKLQEELSLAEAERIAKQSLFELARAGTSASLAESSEVGNLRSYERDLIGLRRELAELDAVFTPEHPRVKRVAAQIAEMQQAVDQEQVVLLEQIGGEYQSALRRQNLLAAQYEEQARLVSDDAVKSIRYDILRREVDTNQQLYDGLLRRVKETGVASALSASNVRILDRAGAPVKPIGPNHPAHAALGSMLGGFLGLLLVLVRARTERVLKGPADVSRCLRSAQLGAIPSAKPPLLWVEGSSTVARRYRLRYTRNGGGSLALHRAGSGPTVSGRPQLERPAEVPDFSPLAESCRATLTSMLLEQPGGKLPKVLAVTSAAPLEGKTTVVSNLAISLARIGRQTLLVDADFRRPQLHHVFDIGNEKGLTSLLREGRGQGMSDWRNAVCQTPIKGLSVLPSGPLVSSSAHDIYSERLPLLLGLLQEQFGVILIDTPPLMPVADARVLAQLADAAVLVVRSGRTTPAVARAAEERLCRDGTQVLGVVLNDWEPVTSDEYYSVESVEPQPAPPREASLSAAASGS